MRLCLLAFTLTLAACSNTLHGVKTDSTKIWNDTKQAIHEATE